MAAESLDKDHVIESLRGEIADIDIERSRLVASFMIDVFEDRDLIKSGALSTEQLMAYGRPFLGKEGINGLTGKRDRRTREVGKRKRELQEKGDAEVAVEQPGRWEWVRNIYMKAIEEECEKRRIRETDRYEPFAWMGRYADFEHSRSVTQQKNQQPTEEIEAVVIEMPPSDPRVRARSFLGHLHLNRRHPGHRSSA